MCKFVCKCIVNFTMSLHICMKHKITAIDTLNDKEQPGVSK